MSCLLRRPLETLADRDRTTTNRLLDFQADLNKAFSEENDP